MVVVVVGVGNVAGWEDIATVQMVGQTRISVERCVRW
jgi:hypothetical protein